MKNKNKDIFRNILVSILMIKLLHQNQSKHIMKEDTLYHFQLIIN